MIYKKNGYRIKPNNYWYAKKLETVLNKYKTISIPTYSREIE